MDVFQRQLEYFMETMTRPEGVLGILGILLICVGHVTSKSLKWYVLAVIMWLSSLSFQINVGETRPVQLAPPLDTLQFNSRPLCLGMIFTLLVPMFMSPRGWRRHIVGWGALGLFLFQMLLAARIGVSDVSSRGELSLLVFLLIFLGVAVGLGRWLQDFEHARLAMRSIVIAAFMFILGTSYQLLMNRTSIIRQNRLFGTSGNPQHAGTLLALSIPVICYFIVRPRQRPVYRVLLSALGGLAVIMLLWTGSRTGMLMCLVGLGLFFRARIGRFLGAGILVGVFVLAALQFYDESTATFSQMFLRGDTRSHVWSSMLSTFFDHMAFGSMGESFGVGENSYLALAANLGLSGLIPIVIVFAIVIKQLLHLQRVRKSLGEYTMLADLVTAGLVSLAVGAFFEGYLLGTLTFPVLIMYTDLVVLRFLLDAADAVGQHPPGDGGGNETSEWDAAYGEAPVESAGDVYAHQP